MKIAYLIMAHNEPEVFKELVSALDYPGNDLYVHIDAKSDIFQFCGIQTKYSKIIFTDRVDNRWGSQRTIEAENILFEAASGGGQYDYYCLISGADYPIKTQQYIHEFLSKNRGKEFVALTRTRSQRESKEVTYKTGYYWILSNYFRTTNIVVQKLMNLIRNIFVGLQKIFGVKRKYKIELRKGSHWCIITDDFCKYLLKDKAYVLKAFRFTLCADEIWMPSILNNSPFMKNVFDLTNPGRSCMREIDWNRGNPYVWQLEDYDQLVHSDRLFARKMNSSSLPLIHKLKENHIV